MLTILSGKIDCTEPICDVIDYDADLTAEGNSAIVIKGMFEVAEIRLSDSSTLTVYGTNLSTSESGGEIILHGMLLDGSELFGRVKISGDLTNRIILIEVPEPNTLLVALPIVFLLVRTIKRRQVSLNSSGEFY